MLGEQIRQLREERGMSVEELADHLDIPPDCLVDVEEGRRRLSKATIQEAAAVLGVPEGDLLRLQQPPVPRASERRAEVTQEGIGRKIRELREQRGMTLGELGRKAELSAAHLSEVERGLSAASLKTLEKISDALGVSTATFLGRDEVDPLGDRLRRLRERVGLTQKQLAEMIGASHALVGQIESGRLQPSVATLTRLAHALGVSPCYFLMEEEVGAARQPADEELAPALAYGEVRDFLGMLLTVSEEDREKLLSLLSLLTQWRGFTGALSCGAPQDDPVTRELMEILAGLKEEEKAFLLESARFVSRKARNESQDE